MTNDLISRSALLEAMRSVIDDSTCPMHLAAEIDQIIDFAPAVDAVEVDKAMAWLEGYTMTDTEQIYSNGIVYVPLFRMVERSWCKCGGVWVFCNKLCGDCPRANWTATNRPEA